ncbi:hypothetical protein [Dactylosporangium sp. NPDC051541]|uniref:hypothetical protein n=1 Tax=Dactylosporangium sp. NPDC051541 TaxID=3363977 RepID=UPI0037B94C3E
MGADEGGGEVPVAGQAAGRAVVPAVAHMFGDAGAAEAVLGPGGVPGPGPLQPATSGNFGDLGGFVVDRVEQHAGGEGVDAAAPPPRPGAEIAVLDGQVWAVDGDDAGGGGAGAGVPGLGAGRAIGGHVRT